MTRYAMDPHHERRPTAEEQTKGLGLFDALTEPVPTPMPKRSRRTAPTSRAARDAVRALAPSMKVRIAAAIVASAEEGMTRKEIARALGIGKDSVNARCAELVATGDWFEHGERNGEKVIRHIGYAWVMR